MGAVSTIENRRWRNAPSVRGYVDALAAGGRPPRELEELSDEIRETERVMLGLRLDEPVTVESGERMLDPAGLERLERLGLVTRSGDTVALTPRGRFLGDDVTATLLA